MALALSAARGQTDLATKLAWHVRCSLSYKGPQRVGEIRRLSLPVEPSNYLFCDITRTVATPRRCAYFYSRLPFLARPRSAWPQRVTAPRFADRPPAVAWLRTGDTSGQ